MARLVYVVNRAEFFLSHRAPLALAARAAGFDVHVATPPSPLHGRIEALGLAWHPVPLEGRSLNPADDIRLTAALTGLYRRLRPDVVHHVAVKAVSYGGLAARLARVPAVVHALTGLGYLFVATGPKAAAARRVAVELFRRAYRHPNAAALFQNPDDAGEFLRRRLVRPDQVTLIRGSGVDVEAFTPAETPPPGPPVVVLPSRLLADKGVREFVAAARLLKGRGVAARFVLAGDVDPLNPNSCTAAEVAAWVDEGAVEHLGHRTDMPDVLRAAHVACLPSYREGTPKALLEGAAAGLPLVTTDAPGCREVVRDGENGLLVPVREAGPLADALGRLLADADLRARMGAASRRRAEAEFRVEHVVTETLGLYTRLLGRAGA